MFRDYLSLPSSAVKLPKMGPIGSPKTSALNNLMPRNNPKDVRLHFNIGGRQITQAFDGFRSRSVRKFGQNEESQEGRHLSHSQNSFSCCLGINGAWVRGRPDLT